MQTVAPRSHHENWSAQFGCCHWFLCLFARTSHTAFTFKSVESDPHEFTCVILTCDVVECWLVAFDASEICSIWSASSHQCMWDRNCWGPLLVVKRKIDWNYWLDVSFIYLSQSYRIRSRKKLLRANDHRRKTTNNPFETQPDVEKYFQINLFRFFPLKLIRMKR